MFRTLRAVGIATAMFAASAVAASAGTVGLLDYSVQGIGNTADVYGAGYNGSTPVGASWSGAAPVVTPPPGNSGGNYQSPFNNTGLVNTQSYFSVGGSSGTNGGPSPLTLMFSTPQSTLKLLWGSIDDYNKIEFFDAANNPLGSATGAGVVSGFAALSSIASGAPGFEVVGLFQFNFGPNELFSNVKFTSTRAAFEFALAAVPVPAAAWLMLSAIGGLGGLSFLSRRKKSAAAA